MVPPKQLPELSRADRTENSSATCCGETAKMAELATAMTMTSSTGVSEEDDDGCAGSVGELLIAFERMVMGSKSNPGDVASLGVECTQGRQRRPPVFGRSDRGSSVYSDNVEARSPSSFERRGSYDILNIQEVRSAARLVKVKEMLKEGSKVPLRPRPIGHSAFDSITCVSISK